jgi:hypothetical protein
MFWYVAKELFGENMSSVFNPEDGSLMFLRNTGGHLPGCSWRAEFTYKAVRFLRNNVHSNAHKVIAGFFLSPDPEVT